MSGIAGVIRFDGGPADPAAVRAMTDAMAHRGPDGIAHWHGEGVALGHCQMCTTPESLEETQPLTNEDESLVLVMDGRVDNWEDLRQLLLDKGARLRTRADAELVLRAYEVWGRDCLERIDGDFAFVIWDGPRREAFCARDRMGIRPFYYHWDGSCLSFASDMHALLGLRWVPERLNETKIAEYISDREVLLDNTVWQDVERILAAHLVTFAKGTRRAVRYWRPEEAPELRHARLEDYVDQFRELLGDQVRRLSRSHLPIACEVSGGLDSSTVFAVAAALQREGRLTAPGLAGYTLRFEEGTRADELAYARSVADHVGVPVEEVNATHPPLDWYADWVAQYRCYPIHPNGALLLDAHARCRASDRRVVLSGSGGDEWCFGSIFYYADLLEHGKLLGFANAARRDVGHFGWRWTRYHALRFGLLPVLPTGLQKSLKRAYWSLRRRPVSHDSRLRPALQGALDAAQAGAKRPAHRLARHEDALMQLLDADRAGSLERRDLLGASNGIETRHPLNTAAIAEFAFRSPEWTRRLCKDTRIVHRAATSGLLPEDVRLRRTKAEFSISLLIYLEEISAYRDGLVGRQAAAWVESDELSRLIQSTREFGQSGRTKWSVWALFGCLLLQEAVDGVAE